MSYRSVLTISVGLGRVLPDAASGVALMYAASMRNLPTAVAVAVAAPAVPETAVLPIAPAHILQPPLGSVYMQCRRDVVDEGVTLREAVSSPSEGVGAARTPVLGRTFGRHAGTADRHRSGPDAGDRGAVRPRCPDAAELCCHSHDPAERVESPRPGSRRPHWSAGFEGDPPATRTARRSDARTGSAATTTGSCIPRVATSASFGDEHPDDGKPRGDVDEPGSVRSGHPSESRHGVQPRPIFFVSITPTSA